MAEEHVHANLSPLYSISDLKAYLYKIRSRNEGLWRYHDVEHNDHFTDCQPEIIKISNTPEDLERYSEILYNILCLDVHKRNKFDVASMVIRKKGSVPNLGIDVLEMTKTYKCVYDNGLVLTSGLFIYNLKSGGTCFLADFREGDVIVSVQRPEVEKIPTKWKRQHLDYYEDGRDKDSKKPEESNQEDINYYHAEYRTYTISTIRDMMSIFNVINANEYVIFNIVRAGERIDIGMKVPFHTKIVARVDVPKIVIKTIPKFEIKNEDLTIRYDDPNDYTDKVYLRMKAGVDTDSRDLYLEIPDTVIGVNFYIDENGNLVAEYG